MEFGVVKASKLVEDLGWIWRAFGVDSSGLQLGVQSGVQMCARAGANVCKSARAETPEFGGRGGVQKGGILGPGKGGLKLGWIWGAGIGLDSVDSGATIDSEW